MGIGELADRVGLSRRAVRFYVQQKLLPPPIGGGRGAHYDSNHVQRLTRIVQLQAAGHSLEAIRRILEGKEVLPPVELEAAVPRGVAELWTRVRIAEGVELHVDAHRRPLDAGQLAAVREAVWKIIHCDEK